MTLNINRTSNCSIMITYTVLVVYTVQCTPMADHCKISTQQYEKAYILNDYGIILQVLFRKQVSNEEDID